MEILFIGPTHHNSGQQLDIQLDSCDRITDSHKYKFLRLFSLITNPFMLMTFAWPKPDRNHFYTIRYPAQNK